ncbi:MAG: diacylglycerol/lipid kinase family protein [Bacteroidales bacterium]|jgi:diacylglycerol kinase (ATP)
MEETIFSIEEHHWHVILNPNALSKKNLSYFGSIKQKLNELKLTYTAHVAESCNSGIETVKKLCLQGARHFIAVGGDGTINEVINGIFYSEIPSKEVYVAVIPIGTGNDWARTHNYPAHYLSAMDKISEARFIQHDIGLVETINNNSTTHKRYFINIAGFGFDSAVIREVNKNKSKVFSKTVYLLSLLKILFTYKAIRLTIKTADTSLTEDIFTIAVGICQYNGNGMRQVPTANPVDGKFDIAIIKKISPFKVIANIKRLYDGSHLQVVKEAISLQSDTVTITATPHCVGEVEGELLAIGDYRISILPSSINIMSMNKNWWI